MNLSSIPEIRMRGTQFCMEWKKSGFNWNHARTFFVVAEEGSFSAVARALGTALEEELAERFGR
jgi:hypothetical protein